MADKTKADLEADNATLTKQVADLTAQLDAATDPDAVSARISLISKTGQDRYRGTYIVPADKPIVLAIDHMEERDLGEIEGDPHILAVRSDSPITPEGEVKRFERNS